jgi:hypothetical protein
MQNKSQTNEINKINSQKMAIMQNDDEKAAKIAKLAKDLVNVDDDIRFYRLLSSNTIKRRFKPQYIGNLEAKFRAIKRELKKLKGEDDSDEEDDEYGNNYSYKYIV